MANSPDVKRYVDLTVFDEDPVTVINEMLATGRGLIPEWLPEVGQIEVVLAEIFALRSAEMGRMANRIPSATLEVLLQLFGLFRSDGVKATAEVTITFTDTNNRTLPTGTQFLYTDAVSGISYIFVLDEPFSSSVHGISGNASVTAQVVGAGYNFTADGSYLSILSSVSFVESVIFSTSPSGGRDAETDLNYFDRATSLLASYTTAATTASQIKYYISTNKTYANRVGVFNRRRYRNRDTTSTSYGYHDGSVLVAVGGIVSDSASAVIELPVSASNLSDLYESLDERTPSGLTIDVMSAELASVDVTATVQKQSNFIASTVSDSIVTALETYLDPNTWSFDDLIVRRNEIISIIDSVLGVDYVSSLSMNGKSLVGSNNIGYYGLGSGSQASFTMDVNTDLSASATFAAGDASVYFVDSDSATDVPVVYMFNNAEFTVNGSGDAVGVTYVASSNGINFNDTSNQGQVVPSGGANFTKVTGDWAGVGTVTFTNASTISGGSNDVSTFIPLDSSVDDDVSADIVLRNLGTLVTHGTITITVV